MVYPDVHRNSERRGLDLESECQIKFKEYKDKKN